MIFAVYKPKGPTSHSVVSEVKRKLGAKKVGHAGTLDPLAEGVLVIGTDEDTKKLSEVVQKEKEYIAEVELGATSETNDSEGPITPSLIRANGRMDQEMIEKVLNTFIGEIEQIPPLYSAVKIKGKEAYKHARKGNTIKMEPRKVEIKNIELLDYGWPVLKIKVITGPGVYIRSLARDIGKKLETGGYLKSLIRTRVGNFTIEKAKKLTDLSS